MMMRLCSLPFAVLSNVGVIHCSELNLRPWEEIDHLEA